ncbi:type IV pilus biogenesis protein PilM [Salipaludibacillus daqingensis]|uniref:type IV pilus biogenesis protein PilM n=1 Tax=Salipaludibacillus daqingensis TaxID=3041001 RepID=UPI002474CED5|nr:pilus assembly protein PilM [Salipaludibacillus daqingensis]
MGSIIKVGKKEHVSFQIKDHIFRCVVTKHASIDSIIHYYERVIPEGILEKGKIIDSESFEMFLSDCVTEWKLKRKDMKFLVPDSTIFFRQLDVPKDLSKEEIRGYINFEIGSTIHVPFEEVYFDFHLLDDELEDEKQQILLFAVPEKVIQDYVARFEEEKMTPVVADVAPLSLYRLYMQDHLDDMNEQVMQLEWDLSSINISIFHEHKPVFMRNITQYFSREDWELTQHDNLVEWVCKQDEKVEGELQDSLIEVERVIDFYKYTMNKGEKEVTKIFLTGDHPKLMLMQKWLEDSLGVLVETEKSLDILSKVNMDVPHRFILPLSLCLKEV